MTDMAMSDVAEARNRRCLENDVSLIFAALTKQQMAVMDYLAYGLSNKEIAGNLNLSSATVKTHILAIYQKTRLANRIQLALNWLKYRGLIQEVDALQEPEPARSRRPD